MALTTTPTAALEAQDDGVLEIGISASATTIKVSPIKKWVNAVETTGGFNTTEGFFMLIDSSGRSEYGSFDTNSVGADNVSTLTGVRRGLSPTGATFTAGTGSEWDAGTRIFIVDYPIVWQNIITKDTAQSITGLKTFSTIKFATAGTEYFELPSLTTTERDALSAVNGMMIYNETTSRLNTYEGGAWGVSSASTVADASESVAGKIELGTVAEQGTKTTTGSTGAALVPQIKNIFSTHATYTPAYLTGGSGALAVAATWASLASTGKFKIEINGTDYDDVNPNFTGDASMADVAASIQTALRTATSSTETVAWSTNHFVFTSASTASTSIVKPCESPSTGTDISGAGGTTYMDADYKAPSVQTAPVLDKTADVSKIPILPAAGIFPRAMIDQSGIGIVGEMRIWTTDTAPTNWLLCSGSLFSLTTYEGLYDVIGVTFGAVGTISGGIAAATFTATAATEVCAATSHGLTNGDVVILTTSGTLPAGLAVATKYYIVNKNTNDFQLSNIPNGDPIDITDTGTGTHTFNPGFAVPDMRGRTALGQDDMGGTSANRVTDSAADTLGSTAGVENIDLAHNHSVSNDSQGSSQNNGAFQLSSETTGSALSDNTTVMNPYITLNYIIRT